MPIVNGVYQYAESDLTGPTFSGFLNLLGDSIRNANNWTAYTPTITMTGGTFAKGSTGTQTGYYRRIGNVLEVKGYISGSGTGFAISGSAMNIGLPSGFSTDSTLPEQFLDMKLFSNALAGDFIGNVRFGASGNAGLAVSPYTTGSSVTNGVDAGRFTSGSNLSFWGTIKIG